MYRGSGYLCEASCSAAHVGVCEGHGAVFCDGLAMVLTNGGGEIFFMLRMASSLLPLDQGQAKVSSTPPPDTHTPTPSCSRSAMPLGRVPSQSNSRLYSYMYWVFLFFVYHFFWIECWLCSLSCFQIYSKFFWAYVTFFPGWWCKCAWWMGATSLRWHECVRGCVHGVFQIRW